MVDENRLILALDVSNQVEAAQFCSLLRNKVRIFKVGLQLFLNEGKGIIDLVRALGGEVFLDLKLHDIPNQVVGACREIIKMKVKMFTIHATGGFEMMERAAKVVNQAGAERPLILAATVLTSLDQTTIRELGIEREITDQVVYLAKLAQKAGLDGVVSSPLEVAAIRETCEKDFLIVTPGIRPEGSFLEDQRRVLTPAEAIRAGASYLVVGRPILEAPDPAAAANQILEEIKNIVS